MFASREDAGRRLARYLIERKCQADVVAGLPRGGVVVAAEIARELRLPLEALVVRKIGHPMHREFAVGAMAEGGVVLLDEEAIGRNPPVREELDQIVEEETNRLRQQQALFHGPGLRDWSGKTVILVDDGLATGATMEAAALSARRQYARRVVVAVPIASPTAVDRLASVADAVEAMWVDENFEAVGGYYKSFSQTDDEEVRELLGLTDSNPS